MAGLVGSALGASAFSAAGNPGAALQALERAIGLTEDPAVRAYLRTLWGQQPDTDTDTDTESE